MKINTSMDSFKLTFLFIILNFANNKAHASRFVGSNCLGNTITPNSPLSLNRKTLLSYLSSNATNNKDFYKATVVGINNINDTLYGSFMCRGDVPLQVCGQCILNATNELSLESDAAMCPLAIEAIIRYDECFVRYSNSSFFSIVDLNKPSSSWEIDANITDKKSFMQLLYDTLKQIANDAANHSIGVKKYATKQARISGFETLFSLAQCTPDLSPKDCRTCLNLMISDINENRMGSSSSVTIENLSCNIRYDVYPFYRPTTSLPPKPIGPPHVPTTNSSITDSDHSQGPTYLSHSCSTNQTIATNSDFQSNRRTLLASLSSNATSGTKFYKTTIHKVNGLFMCRGDVSPSLCQLCVLKATRRISLQCSLSIEAIIWYNHCLLRYSYRSFSSTADTSPTFQEFSIDNTSNLNQQQSFFTWSLGNTVSQMQIDKWGSSIKNYGTRSLKVDDLRTLYILAQCTPDISIGDCSTCLHNIFRHSIPWCCLESPKGKVLYPSCYLMFGLSRFYEVGDEAQGLKPVSTYPGTKANDHMYLKHTCSTNNTFTPNTIYQSNLHTLFTTLSSHAPTFLFYNTTVSAAGVTVYGLFMCRGDVTNDMCQECTTIATKKLASRCPYSKEAIIWYHMCMVRYSNRYFFSTVEEWPRLNFVTYNVTRNVIKNGSYGFFLANTLSDAVTQATTNDADSSGNNKKYATRSVILPGSQKQKVYVLVQCTPDLTTLDCKRCLSDIMSSIPFCCLGRDGGMVLYPSCNLMYALDLFYRNTSLAVAATPATSLAFNDSPFRSIVLYLGKTRLRLISIAMVPIVFLLMLFFANRIRRLNNLRRYKAILKENFGNESTTLESLQFNFAAIEAATNKFSNDNLIGEGGFGKVYKGTLPDDREVAVKRLSKSSGQGAAEFKNEVLLIAKLQHRNLVALLGFCLQEDEKILVYEFVPNKSLDYFLFDPTKQRLLSWCERYKIIGGIAQAIQYLHEYSRLKIIHRDIKPSNVLLDDKMSPKISDFGMARMVAIDQEQGRTNRVVGTYGYMSPEYAMLGRFSEKSDIFSFGVMVLEIVSGKKHSTSYQPYYVDGLLSHAWKQWRDGAPFEILDPILHESCSQIEVMKCIQIGLLCVQEIPDDRPLMAEVVSYLSSPSVELPFPCEPAFFIHGGMETNMVGMELELDRVNITPFSINEMSFSESLPR